MIINIKKCKKIKILSFSMIIYDKIYIPLIEWEGIQL